MHLNVTITGCQLQLGLLCIIKTFKSKKMKKILLFAGMLVSFSQCQKESTTPPSTSCADVFDLTRGLLLHYPLDGDGTEVMEGNCSGVVVGATPRPDRHGENNKAMYFAGEDYIRACNETTASFGQVQPYTFSAWVKLEANEAGGVVISKSNSGVFAGWQLFVREQKVGSYREVTPYLMTTTASIPLGEFVHITASYDGEYLNLYIDGELASSETFAPHKDDQTTPIIIGGDHRLNEIRPDFEGTIDEIRIYKRALDELEIACLANS